MKFARRKFNYVIQQHDRKCEHCGKIFLWVYDPKVIAADLHFGVGRRSNQARGGASWHSAGLRSAVGKAGEFMTPLEIAIAALEEICDVDKHDPTDWSFIRAERALREIRREQALTINESRVGEA